MKTADYSVCELNAAEMTRTSGGIWAQLVFTFVFSVAWDIATDPDSFHQGFEDGFKG